ncbi:MAG: hypothetical protein WC505_02485 [Patescibacteria group bacterium]
MNPALIMLIAAGVSFFFSLIAYGKQEVKNPDHYSAEKLEARYRRVRRVKRICFWLGIILLVAAAAWAIGSRWDILMHNLQKG